MKVRIKEYINWIGPYQLAEYIFFWVQEEYDEEANLNPAYEKVRRLGDWLADTWVADFLQWIHSKRKRHVEVKIENFDVWSMDHTLSIIIVPMLEKLKEVKHGSGIVDMEDVPEELRCVVIPEDLAMDSDTTLHERFDWVLNEMIWAMKQIRDDEPDAPPYPKYIERPIKEWIGEMSEENQSEYDAFRPLREAYDDRIQNGCRLFGKYFRCLWD